MPTRFHITLPHPDQARGPDPSLSFRSVGAGGFAEELEDALRESGLIARWRALQQDPDEVDPAVLALDPDAVVTGRQQDLKIDLTVTTSLPGSILRHRMGLLAGSHWQLRDVTRA
ncbi:MAG TPA: hypothetical protein VFG21_00615 [Xanthomonadaceae bacterium]|nr:hypothetical protein [Xanthomonadaceae bacterium]